MKHLKGRWRLLLRGPKHIILMMAISWFTYWYFGYSQTCWERYDLACMSSDTSELVWKIAIALSQFAGIGLLLLDLDKKLHSLTGTKLLVYFSDKLKAWWRLWFKQKHSIKVESMLPMFHAVGDVSFTHKKANISIEERLAEIEKTLDIHRKAIATEADDRRRLEGHVNESVKRLESVITQRSDHLLDKVKEIHVGGYTTQAWSIFLILYSAVLGVFV
ncbi:hypothetical protein SAMN06297280_0791 [Arsukibacterium tuosuense]|uniref:Uncharacterized protein n=1 Tax=Arsukibacterium tuosuense TaxID=1323745 RepID=A0A285IA23_9GAMM|nr:hypothetical protein [Arsukibacterium tuosuense]SNY44815.1 hypothetical protein SAMN06297280_0791 [Arsukibacterium tuosuense]